MSKRGDVLRQNARPDLGLQAIRTNANERAERLREIIADIQASGITSAAAIARELNQRGISATTGGQWQAVQVQRLLQRLEPPTPEQPPPIPPPPTPEQPIWYIYKISSESVILELTGTHRNANALDAIERVALETGTSSERLTASSGHLPIGIQLHIAE